MKAIALSTLLLFLARSADAQWSTPVLATNVNNGSTDPSPTLDGLTLYWAAIATGNFELYRATRSAPHGSFVRPTLIVELADPGNDASPCPSSDDLELFFQSDRAGGLGGNDIWRAARASVSAPFAPPTPVTELNSAAFEGGPSLTADGLRIYFTRLGSGVAGGFNIWTATRPHPAAPFGPPALVAELNTSSADLNPHVSPDDLAIFFASNRPGGQGNVDVWMSTRTNPAAPFGLPFNVVALNSSATDASPAFAGFHDELFLHSTRAGGTGPYDIYSARFTGLLARGLAGPSSVQTLRFSDPSSAGLPYLAAASLGSSPGTPIDQRVLPLNVDPLLHLTLGGRAPVMSGFMGTLSQEGIAAGSIAFAGFPQLLGFRFVTAFVVLDPSAPSGIKTISNAHEVLVQ